MQNGKFQRVEYSKMFFLKTPTLGHHCKVFFINPKVCGLYSQFVISRIAQFKTFVNSLCREGTISVEVSRMAIRFQKICIVQTPAVSLYNPQF